MIKPRVTRWRTIKAAFLVLVLAFMDPHKAGRILVRGLEGVDMEKERRNEP